MKRRAKPGAIGRTANGERRQSAVRASRPTAHGRTLPIIAITIGDPAGIGPEIALNAAVDPAVLRLCRPVLVGSRALLTRVARKLKRHLPKDILDPTPEFAAGDVTPGTVQAANGAAAARWVDAAIAGCRENRFAAMVTCPLNKEALAAGGVPFPGHTELLAHRCGVSGEIMLMYDKKIAVALVTVHQAYTSVPGSLSVERIVHTGELLAQALRRLRKGEPRIAVLGLNPHAGEHGLFGDEESRFVVPAVEELRRRGVHCDGPLPPDTAFAPLNRKKYDGHVCLYHDQGLIPFKALAFDDGVNVTLGLPIVRTSVDHGTAFDIAWQGKATHRSLVSAIGLAVKLSRAKSRKKSVLRTERLSQAIAAHGLERYSEAIIGVAKPSIELQPNPMPIVPCCSKFGGSPDVPRGFKWPTATTGEYRFIGQIDLGEVPQDFGNFPPSGLLSFFYLHDEEGEKFAREPDYVRAFHFPGDQDFQALMDPRGARRGMERRLSLSLGADVPPWPCEDDVPWQIPEALQDEYWELRCSLHPGHGFLLGYPFTSTLAYDPTPGVGWTSLLTLRSDQRREWCWGDGDWLVTFIKEARLRKCDFAEVKSDTG